MSAADRELEELRQLVQQQTATLQQIRESQAQVLKYVQFGDIVRQQTQLLISVQQNQANVLKAFQDYQVMIQQYEKMQSMNPLNFSVVSPINSIPSFPIQQAQAAMGFNQTQLAVPQPYGGLAPYGAAPAPYGSPQPYGSAGSSVPYGSNGSNQPYPSDRSQPDMPQPGDTNTQNRVSTYGGVPGVPGAPGMPQPYSAGSPLVPVVIPPEIRLKMEGHTSPHKSAMAHLPPQPTVIPLPAHLFSPEKDAMVLRKAMKGLGTNERKIIDILGARTNQQRQLIRKAFAEMFPKRDLIKDLISETSGNFKNILVALMMTHEEFDAHCLNMAMKGLGTDDGALIEILCSKSNEQMRSIRNIYKSKYGDLDRDITDDTSGDYRTFLLALAQGNRSTDPVNPTLAKEDAMKLYIAGEDRVGTDENVFIEILSKRSNDHLKAVIQHYVTISDFDLEHSIRREMSFDLKKALVSCVRVIQTPYEFFADRLESSMAGLGTDDTGLIRLIVSRSEIDLMNIKAVYFNKYGRTLERAIHSETSGDYRKLLMLLVGTHVFNPDEDAKKLKKAVSGFRVDNDTIVNILGSRTYNQRRQIITTFKTNYGQDLEKALLSKTTGDFRDLLQAMMMTPDVLDAWTVERSIRGLGTDDDTLIEILCTRDNAQIKALKEAYQKMHNKSIEQDVHDDTSGDYQNLLKALLAANRDETNRVNIEEAKTDATALFKAGADKIGTDEDVFIKIMTTRNFPQLRLIFDHYDKMCDHDIIHAIKAETSFNFKKCLVTIVESTQNPSRFYAKKLHESMDGVGTNEDQLIRVVLTRCEIDMPQIREQYRAIFKKTLERDISGDTSGPFKRLLKKLIETQTGAIATSSGFMGANEHFTI